MTSKRDPFDNLRDAGLSFVGAFLILGLFKYLGSSVEQSGFALLTMVVFLMMNRQTAIIREQHSETLETLESIEKRLTKVSEITDSFVEEYWRK